ncbi:hybrid sensor histidine kinase/response regulator transcription factor [Flavihumibacter sp. CACIAM 22H1]|uniref:hybrid sensor histidine kinase/response regulator transcription factor n=1 Tax=Flavihumibacter sp. CACIAM 22H1 TaxID=1812911 RepID=UPI0007A82EB4|nr:hybrid sensor histidine kinase/response regulator transcription factor [Flavihumibacter sp. CACIAM 22H1]KYP14559.1 MAG: hypothetical protein A1D16_00285 [Flavihumibacter sp. CACIAM 22H1]
MKLPGIFQKFFCCLCLLIYGGLAMAADQPISYIGIEQGLSNNAVTAIYQDKNGFLWFGTYDGLNLYNGYSIQVFRNRIGDSTTLTNNNIYAIQGDALNRIWTGSEKGACVYQPANGQFIPLYYLPQANSKPAPLRIGVHCFATIGSQRMLAGSSQYGLLDYAEDLAPAASVPLETPDGNTQYMVSAIEYDSARQKIWVFVQQKGLYLYDPARKLLHLQSDQILQAKSLKIASDGKLWLGNHEGLFKYTAASRSYTANAVPNGTNVAHLNLDKKGILWIGTDGNGLWSLEPGALKAAAYLDADGRSPLNSNSIFAVYSDLQNRKWIGTLRGGINMIDSRIFPFQLILRKQAEKESPVQNFILSLCEDPDQNIWIGTDGAGLRYWNRKQHSFTDYTYKRNQPGGISSNFITNIMVASDGDTWVSTWFGGINRIHHGTRTIRQYSCYNPVSRMTEPHAWIVFEDRHQQIWASTTNDGALYSFNSSTDRFELFDPAITNLQSLYEDPDGQLWGGNYSEIIRIDRRLKKHQRFAMGNTVRCIYQDKRGNFWLGTQGGGLLLFDKKTGTYKRFTTDDGLPSNSILRILEDDHQVLWLTTFNGLCKFDPVTGITQNFTHTDGLQSNQFSFNAGIRLQSGEMVIGGIKGLNLFHPDSVRFGTAFPPLFLSGLSVSNKSMDESRAYLTRQSNSAMQELTVPFDLANIHLDFLGLDYSFPDKIQYAYMLDGWDKDWNFSKQQRTATYMRLQEGRYTFKVKATGLNGQWGAPADLLTIIILPPWYRTGWAYLFYLIAAIGLIIGYSVYAARQARLIYEVKLATLENQKEKELHEKKLSVFTQVSHEFRTPLTLIINPVKELLQQKNNQEAQQELNVVYRNARRLLSLVDQLLHFRKADSGGDELFAKDYPIHDLCSDIYQCFVQEAKLKSIAYQFIDRLNDPSQKIAIDKEKIEMALFNLLSNAFKFTPAGGTIRLEIGQEQQELLILIADSGHGIAPEEQEKIFKNFQQAGLRNKQKTTGFGIGLFLVHHFISLHNGSISCESETGKGSRFLIRLPLHTLQNKEALYSPSDSGLHKEWMQELPETRPENELHDTDPAIADPVEKIITERKQVLLIDDNIEIRTYLKNTLGKKYLILSASNGEDGFKLATERLPDLIICDINMEGISGLEFCRQLKASSYTSHIPLILLTGETGTDMQVQGMEGGADDYITKPFELDVLVARMEALLRSRSLLHQYFLDEVTLQTNPAKVPAEYQHFLRRCMEVIEENIDNESFTIKQFAQQMGMSQSGLYQKIKTISGQSLNSFIRTIRLRKAAVLMLSDNLNVSQAGFQVGFADSRYFREQFSKLFGMNPSDYIKKYRGSFNREFTKIVNLPPVK